jgi:4-carboxymuconolactone decarboxylase
MKKIVKTTVPIVAMLAGASIADAADRFPVPKAEQLTPEQAAFVQHLLAGPRGDGSTSPDAVDRILQRGPFNAWTRSPVLAERLQKVGEYIRFETSLPLRLNEFAILIAARHWTSQYEWFAHLPLALKAGLDPKVASELADNRRPAGMKDDEAAIYDFCTQLHRTRNVTDEAFNRAKQLFGEKGVMDLIGVTGYYTTVSMTLNVANVPLPGGAPLPLKPID